MKREFTSSSGIEFKEGYQGNYWVALSNGFPVLSILIELNNIDVYSLRKDFYSMMQELDIAFDEFLRFIKECETNKKVKND